jgi:tetratricopeptide (TPR) repeat protein
MNQYELWNELGNLYLNSGAYLEAADAYLKAIQLNDQLGSPYSGLALAYVKQGEYEKAIDFYRRSIELSSDNKEKAIVWYQLGNVYVQLKNYSEAVLAYQVADELEQKTEESLQPSDWVDTATFDGLIDEIEDDALSDAQEEILVSGLEAVPDVVTVSQITDNAAEYQQDLSTVSESASAETWADANKHWEMALDREAEVYFPEPEDDGLAGWLPIPEVELLDGFGLQPGSSDIPRDDFDQDEQYHPPEQDPDSLDVMEAAPATNNRKYEYNEDFSLRVELVPQEKNSSGFAQRSPDQKSSAQVEHERKKFYAQTFQKWDQDLDEIKIEIYKFKRVVQINPRNAAAWDSLGTHYKSAGMYKDAILAYQQAISANPSKSFYHHHLALVFAAEGRNEDAIMAYQKVIELDPDHSLANAALGGYYRKMGLEELAQKHIGKAMKNIYNSESEYNQACLEAICGNPDQAIELLRIALEEKQTYVNWVMHDPDLDAIREHPSFKQLISDFIK